MRVSEKYPNGTHKDGHLCLHNLILKLERVEKHFSIDNKIHESPYSFHLSVFRRHDNVVHEFLYIHAHCFSIGPSAN